MVYMFKKGQINYKICFIPYSTTLSIKESVRERKKTLRRSKIGGGGGVGLTVVTDSIGVFLNLSHCIVKKL